MKKLLFPIVALLLFSCSSDDDDPVPQIPAVPNFMKATVNGTPYTFNKFVVTPQFVTGDGYSYTDLKVEATIEGDDTIRIEFNCEQDMPGSTSIYFFYLFNNGEFDYDFEETDISFAANLSTNANKRLIGTFSGTLDTYDSVDTIEVTNGSFDISY